MANSVLSCKQLSWHVNNKRIVSEINFVLNKGETVGIVGPNGAGKTTLLKCLSSQIKNIDGHVFLHGHNMQFMPAKSIAKHISVVSQQESPAFNLTVQDIVQMGLIPHKGLFERDTEHDRIKISRALAQVELTNKNQQLFSTLSGGEQQRCLIARAIVQSADILIMDEPTNHLDIYYQHQILQLVKKLNLTLLITIHDLNLAAQYCDRLLIMKDGELLADNSTSKVLSKSLLKETFGLDCHIDENPFTNKPRITFKGGSHVQID